MNVTASAGASAPECSSPGAGVRIFTMPLRSPTVCAKTRTVSNSGPIVTLRPTPPRPVRPSASRFCGVCGSWSPLGSAACFLTRAMTCAMFTKASDVRVGRKLLQDRLIRRRGRQALLRRRLEEADRALDRRVGIAEHEHVAGDAVRVVLLVALGALVVRGRACGRASRPRKSPRPPSLSAHRVLCSTASSISAISFIARSPSLPTSTSSTTSGASALFGSSVTTSATCPWKSDQTSSNFTPVLPSASEVFCFRLWIGFSRNLCTEGSCQMA